MSSNSPHPPYNTALSPSRLFSSIALPRQILFPKPPAGPGSASLPGLHFSIHPSYLIKSPLQKSLYLTYLKQDRLAAEEYKVKAVIALARIRRTKGAAEENKALKSLQEIRVLQKVALEGQEYSSLGPQAAFDLACASPVVQIRECENLLGQLNDLLEETRAHVQESQSQVGSVLSVLQSCHINVNLPPDLLPDYPKTKGAEIFSTNLSRPVFMDLPSYSSSEDGTPETTEFDESEDVLEI
ncbi:hypothetical protein GALMADRAFT_148628 [Galerina marginata CBS 339.88]|uniref:Uncharacterized protein n=1 Tax=Galerina marginata (strain CBS 339.88) TaxID=685588 RepID=A0A067S3X1_GALM3|nr:hypothetical protein GALMADRAFT_148628 [Galerina marginata CBS 339.88]